MCPTGRLGSHDRPAFRKGRFERFKRRLKADMAEVTIVAPEETRVERFMPRFGFKSSFDLKDGLSAMGMPDPFNPERVDFSGIPPRSLWQKSRIFDTVLRQRS